MTKEKRQGTVVWFNDRRAIGFINPEDGEKDFFVHFTNVVTEPNQFKTLVAGQKVTFVVGANKKGPQAEEVTVIEDQNIAE
jgi:CspA family cold shock protein